MDFQAIQERMWAYQPRKQYCPDTNRDVNRVFVHRHAHRWAQRGKLKRVHSYGYDTVPVVRVDTGEWVYERRFVFNEISFP